ncbi:MAG: hypothetical protein Q8L34_06875 [Candidatus Woesearchaeota archaeon]|nr:hypothetical protein [Candidatus Woesearchaeota archaeon]
MTNEESATKENQRILGPGYYKEVGRKILDQGLEVYVGDELIPYADKVITPENFPEYPYDYNRDGKVRMKFNQEAFSKEARSFRSRYAESGGQWVFQHNLFVRDKGIFVVHDREVDSFYEFKDSENRGQKNKRVNLHVEQLQERLKGGKEEKGVTFSPDSSVRFTPWDALTRVERHNYFMTWHPGGRDNYHTVSESRRLSAEEVVDDGFMIASFGVSGAEVLAQIVERTYSKSLEYWTVHSLGVVVHENYTLGVEGYEYGSFNRLSFNDGNRGYATAKEKK